MLWVVANSILGSLSLRCLHDGTLGKGSRCGSPREARPGPEPGLMGM